MREQPNLSALFERHIEKANRCVAGFDVVFVLNRSGEYRHYRPTRASQARLDRVKKAFGKQVHVNQFDFADRVECQDV